LNELPTGLRPTLEDEIQMIDSTGVLDAFSREFITLFVGVAVAWSLVAHAEESGTLGTTEPTTATLPKIDVARVKPVESTPPNLRLSDDRIDLMSGITLSSNQAIGGSWGIPVRPPTPFDERYGQW
jgi:hypothetical protein